MIGAGNCSVWFFFSNFKSFYHLISEVHKLLAMAQKINFNLNSRLQRYLSVCYITKSQENNQLRIRAVL